MSVTNTYTVGDSRPLWRFGNIPLTIVSQTKSEEGLIKQAMSPKFSSTILFLDFLLHLSLFENSSTNLSSNSFWADIYLVLQVVHYLIISTTTANQNAILFRLSSWL